MRRVLLRWVVWLAGTLVLAAGMGLALLATIYVAGVPLPIPGGMAPVSFASWTGARKVEARVGYTASLTRRDGRAFLTAELEMPESVRVLDDYFDGGRRLVATCGPQRLWLRRLGGARIVVEKPLIRISGTAEIELEGPIAAADSWPVTASVETGFDRATIWARLASLDAEGLPRPMVEAIARQSPRRVWTVEQVLDLAQDALTPELARLLARHRDRLDFAFEDIMPRIRGDRLAVDATFSLDEAAVLALARDRILALPFARIAALVAPAPAQAQLPGLDDLRRTLEEAGRALEQAGRELGAGGEPDEVLGKIVELADCWTAF